MQCFICVQSTSQILSNWIMMLSADLSIILMITNKQRSGGV